MNHPYIFFTYNRGQILSCRSQKKYCTLYLCHIHSPFLPQLVMSQAISKLIEQYRCTKDNDLKYMLLRRDFEIKDIEEELLPLINDLLLPILVEEQDMEILNLVSFQVFPNVVLCMINNSIPSQLKWLTSLVWNPLLDQSMVHADRSFVLIETLRNILQKIEKASPQGYRQPVTHSLEFISKFIVEMKRHMCEIDAAQLSHSLSESNMLIYIESLDLLLKLNLFSDAICPPSMAKLPFSILNDVFTIAQDYSATNTNESIDKITEKLFLTSTQLAHPMDLEKLCLKINYNTLSVISRIWYKFGPIVNGLFADRLLPIISSSAIVEECSVEEILEIIYNFHPYFSIRRLKNNRPLLSESTINQLREGLFSMLSGLNDSLKREQNERLHNDSQLVDDDDGIVSDNDPEQQAYLEELISDDYDENMYNSDTDNENADGSNLERNDEPTKDSIETNKILSIFAELHYPQEERFSELLTELQAKITITSSFIDKILSQEAIALSTCGGEIADLNEILNEVKSNKLTRKNAIFHTLTHTLSLQSCSELADLQLSVEVIDHLLVKNHSNNINRDEQFQLIKLILPHLKTNKSFIDTLKAGNYTQKIDEGVTLRTMILSLLLQLLPLDYSMLGEILPTISRYSVRDKDLTVRDLSLQLLNQILSIYYNYLIGIDWDWYNNNFYQVLQENCTKKDIDTNILQKYPPYFP